MLCSRSVHKNIVEDVMCTFPVDQLLPCGMALGDWHYLMALAGIVCGGILWSAIYNAFLN